MQKPDWIVEAERCIGLKEVPGPKHESKILNMWQAIKMGGIKDDETPWCAAFVGACLEAVGIRSSRSGWAKSYLKWGVPLTRPAYGCIAVLSRSGGGGHVFFVTGIDHDLRLIGIGGNQGNQVSIAAFEHDRVLGLRWPAGIQVPSEILWPQPDIAAQPSSTNEA
jgi:uncharacterized protein (TIGR02594 family)